jgi:hypothetical protein
MLSLSERLEAAATTLSGSEPLKERLARAWQHLDKLRPQDFPRDVRSEFEELYEAMHRETPLPGESATKASLRKLSLAEATRHAALIVRTYGHVVALKSAMADVAPRSTTARAPRVARLVSSNQTN